MYVIEYFARPIFDLDVVMLGRRHAVPAVGPEVALGQTAQVAGEVFRHGTPRYMGKHADLLESLSKYSNKRESAPNVKKIYERNIS